MGKERDFKEYIAPEGEYYLTAVNMILPFLDGLTETIDVEKLEQLAQCTKSPFFSQLVAQIQLQTPVTSHSKSLEKPTPVDIYLSDECALDRVAKLIVTSKGSFYHQLEDYQEKRTKGALVACYLILLDLIESFEKNKTDNGLDALHHLKTSFVALIPKSPRDILLHRTELLTPIKENLHILINVSRDRFDDPHILRLFKTSFLAFRILNNRLGSKIFKIIPGVTEVVHDLSLMMDEINIAYKRLTFNKAEALRLSEEKAALEVDKKEREEEKKGGFSTQFKGACKRTKKLIEKARNHQMTEDAQCMLDVNFLIEFFNTLKRDDDLSNFWWYFGEQYRFQELLRLFDLKEEQQETWWLTRDFKTGQSLGFSYGFYGATITKYDLQQNGVRATNRLRGITLFNAEDSLATLRHFSKDVASGVRYSFYDNLDAHLPKITGIFEDLLNKISGISQFDAPALSSMKKSDEAPLSDDVISHFKSINREYAVAIEQFKVKDGKLSESLEALTTLKHAIDEVSPCYNRELIEVYHNLVSYLYLKVFTENEALVSDEKENGKLPSSEKINRLKNIYVGAIQKIERAKQELHVYASAANCVEASVGLKLLNDYVIKTSKSPWCWLCCFISPTYRRCLNGIKDELVNFKEKDDKNISLYERLNQKLETNLLETWRWSFAGRMVNNMKNKMSCHMFFNVGATPLPPSETLDQELTVPADLDLTTS